MTTPNTTGTTPATTPTTSTSVTNTYPTLTGSRRELATSETKPAFKTTEMLFYVLTVAGVLIATNVVDGFRANQGWLYVTLLTVGYMISRGLAKSGSYAKDNDPRTDAYPDSR